MASKKRVAQMGSLEIERPRLDIGIQQEAQQLSIRPFLCAKLDIDITGPRVVERIDAVDGESRNAASSPEQLPLVHYAKGQLTAA